MGIGILQFPEDIKWKRLCVSEDMVDEGICDKEKPPRWRSSVAAFSYEPPKEEQVYEGRIITYLKIVATITGFQPNGKELDVSDDAWDVLPGIEEFRDKLDEYFPCYGALLSVSVGPTKPEESVFKADEYPYFVDFEPKKRELYEMVSESGERVSRSVQSVNVKKGTTTTNSTEVLDIDMGFNVGLKVGGEKEGAGLNYGQQGQWGTKELSQTQRMDIRTTDGLEEIREGFSRTTNLSQMYSLFQAYHLGTNRAIFFLQPRPHIVTSNFTFVNGPRQLEGIQEVFLVVSRPHNMMGLCLEVELETAHVGTKATYSHKKKTDDFEFYLLAKAENRGGTIEDDSVTQLVQDSQTYYPPAGWEITDFNVIQLSAKRLENWNVTHGSDYLTIFGAVTWRYEDRDYTTNDLLLDGELKIDVRIYLQEIAPTPGDGVETLFLTGRRLCCCKRTVVPLLPGEWISYEKDVSNRGLRFVAGPANESALIESREMSNVIGQEILRSVSGRGRQPAGQVHYYQTDYFHKQIARLLRKQPSECNPPVSKIPGISETIAKRLQSVLGEKVNKADILSMPTERMCCSLNMSDKEIRDLRLKTIGLGTK
ncbi:hypothetical protein [Methanolobus sp. WCC4]|uniref:hypothetical protein n=1 Tax=Methanolobus sp. WCC4 TaxID=3125784 RepID=UPI0030F8F0CD